MAIIESLSVANGGGVVSSASQSKQIENTVSIFIGLGGTGTDAIRCIKKQVNERLNPDNAEAYDNPNSNVSIREYRHIKFLSVDTDYRALKRSDYDILDSTEKWYLSLPDYRKDNDTASRPDLKWINTKEKSILSNVIARGNGTGGFRQIGRYLFYEKIDAFEEKIIQLVDEAKEGISDSRVVVHIFSSVSGGTGSGMFLDVCYAVRKALSGIANKMIVGYFFMPDISLSVKGLDNNSRKNISYNGYAALQELNYCMGFPNNGGSFRQVIKDGTYLEWNCRPVDTCHIIGAQTENFAVVTDDAYDYAMHTVTEYVMHYLYENHYNDFVSIYALMSDQCRRKVSVLSLRTGGYNPCLVSLGAACASIPYREINTYLVSGVFDEYRKKHTENVIQADVEDAINKAWGDPEISEKTMVDKIYASILKKLSGANRFGLQDYNPYQAPDGAGKPWKYLFDTADFNYDNALEAYYQNALYSHIKNLATNADKLIDQSADGTDNKDSLIYLLDQALDPIVRDINRGPRFAKNIIDYVDGISVLNLIAGLKAKNNVEYQNVEKDRTRIYEDYQNFKMKFFNLGGLQLMFYAQEHYNAFEFSVQDYVELIERTGGVYSTDPNAKPMVGVFEHVDNILNALEKQIRDRILNYYAPLCSVLCDVTETFEANYKDIRNNTDDDKNIGFDRPLVSVQDENIISFLDECIREIPMVDTFRGFMGALIDAGYDVWQKREERMPKVVNSFFVGSGGVFRNSAGMTVDAFLERKYGLSGVHLEQKIINEYVRDLMNASSPLLPINVTKIDGQRFYKNIVSYPDTSSVLPNALESPNSGVDYCWARIPLSLIDRFIFIQTREYIPLQAYAEIENLERLYYESAYSQGAHLYEENGIYEDMPYSDWRTLPSITLPSVMGENIPDALKAKRDSVKQLFDKAVEHGVIKLIDPNDDTPYGNSKENDYCYFFDLPDDLQKEIDEIPEEIDRIITLNSASEKSESLGAIQTRISELLSGKYKELTRTDILLKQHPCRTDVEEYDRILKLDFLYASPVYQIKVREIIEKIDSDLKTLKDAEERLRQISESL